MKIRNGFVSNSSSSSFIVINNNYSNDGKNQAKKILSSSMERNYGMIFIPDKYGHSEFGWDIDDFHDFYSKLNFCFLQTRYTNEQTKQQWQDMIMEIFSEDFDIDANHFDLSLIDKGEGYNENTGGYIDHASCSGEGMNTEMFESKEQLRRFLYSDQSYIHTDNDNY